MTNHSIMGYTLVARMFKILLQVLLLFFEDWGPPNLLEKYDCISVRQSWIFRVPNVYFNGFAFLEQVIDTRYYP